MLLRLLGLCHRAPRTQVRRRASQYLRFDILEDRTVPSLIGTEFHANGTTVGNQSQSASASSANGRTVIVWTHQPDTASDSDIRASIYDSSKTRVIEIPIAATDAIEKEPAVAIDNLGNLVVVWTSRVNNSATDRNLFGSRFTAAGNRVGGIFTVANSSRIEYDPSVAMRGSSGEFVVTYTSPQNTNFTQKDAFARMFTTSGGTVIKTFAIGNTSADEEQTFVARNSNGAFVIGYQVANDIRMRRYDATGNSVGVHRIAGTTRLERFPNVAISDQGHSVITWQEFDSDASNWHVRARRVTNTGGLGSVIAVRATASHETKPIVAMDRSDADFVIAYQVGPVDPVTSSTKIFVSEFSNIGFHKGTFDLKEARAAPFVSIDGFDTYMVTYTTLTAREDDPGQGIFGRGGRLS